MSVKEIQEIIFIIEIALTIFAWMRGWGWRALIPMGIGYIIKGLFILLEFPLPGVYIDIIVYIVLIILLVKNPRK
jgi:hypothetical protein